VFKAGRIPPATGFFWKPCWRYRYFLEPHNALFLKMTVSRIPLYQFPQSFPWFSLGLVYTYSGTIQSINPSVNSNSIKINKGMKNKEMKDFPEGWGG